MTTKRYIYEPDYAIPPGETLAEIMEANNISQAELASRTGRPRKTINEIIKGKTMITPETAIQLERALGVPAHFWISLESNYQEILARNKEKEELAAQIHWLRKFPVDKMVKYGWIKGYADKVTQLQEVLNFFGVASIDAWENHWSQIQVSFRKSSAFECAIGSVSAWLRKGEIEANLIDCASFNREKLCSSIPTMRSLTLMKPEEFIPRLRGLCAQSGVALVFVKELPKCPISGAARWLNPNKAMIQLSIRYKTNDHLWFTFFHEIAHILKDSKRSIYIDDYNMNSEVKMEEEANAFARDTLIPPEKYNAFLCQHKNRITEVAIREFANAIEIHPGIVVGRLQHDRIVQFNHFNWLKAKYHWAE